MREEVGKSRKTVFFQWPVAPEGRKVGSLKRRVRSHLARWDEKVHAVVARSTFPSQNVQNTPGSDHFWKLRCRKSARRCGAKMREAHSEVKMYKTPQLRSTFRSCDVEKLHAVVARSTFRSQNVQNTPRTDHFWTFRARFAWQAQGITHLLKSEQNVRVLSHCQKRWQAWGIWRGSAKMHFPWQAQYKRHFHRSCSEVRARISWEGLRFGASDLQVCWDDFAWQAQHFVWPGITFSWQAQ